MFGVLWFLSYLATHQIDPDKAKFLATEMFDFGRLFQLFQIVKISKKTLYDDSPVILVLRRLRQDYHRFETSQGYIISLELVRTTV